MSNLQTSQNMPRARARLRPSRSEVVPPSILVVMLDKSVASNVGNSFPKEASNTDDWLDAIGLVRSAPFPSQKPIAHECGVHVRSAEPLQDSSRGYELGRRRKHDRKRDERESADLRPSQASGGVQLTHTHAHGPSGLLLTCGRSRLRR